eukprot:CAMPEP_0197725696 /NCGR_PEP_ID=MMETSP1434-20131217/9384_1 /TAXON_ID=265543 /ORGANISM="Minutocellus polymorphus, Strain CCMP3303" /LENGTH=359 /DNA_ID=CAMNT_0043311303 /DNA_START=83 /DNA_END=1162 /DNA_ORIENTATION=+
MNFPTTCKASLAALLLAATPCSCHGYNHGHSRLLQEEGAAPAPANDVCDSQGGTVPVLTPNASAVLVASTAYATPKTFSCEAVESIGIYYHFMGTGARFRISTCHAETSFHTNLIVSDANCAEVGCGEPYNSDLNAFDCEENPLGGMVELWTDEGANYTLVVRGETSVKDKGVFGLSLVEDERPSNDVCHDPEELQLNDGVVVVTGSNDNATRSELDCWPDVYPVVYYGVEGTGETFTATTCSNSSVLAFNSTIMVNDFVCNEKEGQRASGCGTSFSSADFECDDTGNAAIVEWETEKGVTYVVMVLSDGQDGRGEFALTIQAGDFSYESTNKTSGSNTAWLSTCTVALLVWVTLGLIM